MLCVWVYCSVQSAHVIQRIWIKYRHVMLHHDDVSIDDTIFYVHSSANIIILHQFLLIKSFNNGLIVIVWQMLCYYLDILTPARTHSISGLKSWVLKFTFLAYNDSEKWPRFFLFWNSLSPFRVAAAHCQKICPVRLNWPGRLASNSDGARWISK